MGQMYRRYWIPALLSSELPEPDCAPVQVRLLGESLVAFRDSMGRVGLLDEFCAHRRTSLVYGRNENCGLTCLYHGWKYDVEGNILETPAEPADSTFKDRIRQPAYPTYEDAGFVWAYLGPPDRKPPIRRFQWDSVPASHLLATKIHMACNYLQGVESAIDTAHISFLHSSTDAGVTAWGFGSDHAAMADRAPRISVENTTYGFRYASIRTRADGDQYIRITPFIMPWHTFIPETADGGTGLTAFVPRDDTSHWAFEISVDLKSPIDVAKRVEVLGIEPPPEFQKLRTVENRYLQDQEVMKTRNFTGIYGILNQDQVVQESMGPIVDRSKEHLGVSDKAIIAMRRLLLASVKAFMAGEEPPALDPSIPFENIRGVAASRPAGVDWSAEFPLDPNFNPRLLTAPMQKGRNA
jgi:phthalate 4,5-dioxygenase oxygenase subunit